MSSARSRAPEARVSRASRAHLLVVLALGLLSFLQRPGSTTFDTKFDLTADPGAFLRATLHLWNPELSFGELQNQAYGYLFPQGTFFLGGDLLGIPDWVVQRSWSALVLIVAYDGARRLFRAWGVRGPSGPASDWLPIVAGLAYAFAPRLLGLSGVLTAEVLPTAVLPWVVLPLVLALRGRYSPRLGALLSGVAVLCMGGVNAVEVLATLPLPALLLACSLGTTLGRRLSAWWVGAVALACAWWMLPLLVLGKYSPPFLDYIETAAATTHPLGWTNATRGADHWLGFIQVGGEPWWPGAFDLATMPVLIALTAVVGALSLAGLFHPSMPARVPLALSALLGLVLLTIAHGSTAGSPISGAVASLLDGSLAPLRNVHKVDPLVRLPLALGFAHGVGLLAAGVRARSGGRAAVRLRLPRPLRWAVPVLAVALLAASALPLFEGTLRKPGWDAVPRAWEQTTDYLAKHADGRRALVLPGSGFGQQTWGWTIDEPIQGLARSPWVSRSQVPLVPGPTIRFLDSIEDRIIDGRGSPALADVLARSGIGYVVVRRDLDLYASDAPSTSTVDQAIAQSPGLEEVAGFGSTGLGDQDSISVYAVRRNVPVVEAVESASTATVAGGPEDLITLMEAGDLDARRPVLIQTPTAADSRAPDLVADGYRLRERQFGRLRDSLSQVMTTAERYRNKRAAHDYPGVDGVARIAASYPEISALSASSSSGYADTLGAVRPELGPYSAVDGVADTYWRSAPLEHPDGQWLQVRLKRPQPLPYVDVTVGVDGFSGLPVRRIRVAADGQVSEHAVDPATGVVRVTLSGAAVRTVRVTILDTYGEHEFGVIAIRDIGFPGLALGRTLVVPPDGADGATDFVFRAQPERRACVTGDLGLDCDAEDARPAEEASGLNRTFTTTTPGTWTLTGTVTARSSASTAALLLPLAGQVGVVASSVLADDPAVSGQFAFDGDPGTPWLAARGEQQQSLELSWKKPRTLTRLRVIAAGGNARSASRAVLEADGQRREVDLGSGGLGFFEPLRTDHVTITFPASPGDPRPLGIGELAIDGIEKLTYAPAPSAATGAQCGLGPEVVVDGRTVRTRVTGRIGDVLDGGALRLSACGDPVELSAGTHTLTVGSTDRFVPTTVALTAADANPSPTVGTRTTEIRRWQSTDRSVYVGPGEAAILRIPENLNAGWRATLDGKVLEQVAPDGWQQGYRVPAGAGGLVHLVYTPDSTYRLFLLLGGIAGLLLLVGALVVGLRERRRARSTVELPEGLARPLPAGRFGIALVALAGIAGGVPLLVGTAGGLLLRRRPALVRWAAVALIAVAGIAAAVTARIDVRTSWSAYDLVTGAAIGLLLATLTYTATKEDSDD
ncbi:alpha-(1-_3)-arabinofuranosyltransferase domain-containing protein [Nocardioides marmoriginsengisoli]|uniref:alpha-(1->3)-arabinofuranosyltransferase domain-containing protein n=1 Tax=Nocardioides marmoriginsengisoli TaxID=661483 RepID=UPI00161B592D|nr:alpha-(1->3)-arabinofuranosyltransferase family protein [Nocardioides marmoriginsengisoli]